MGTMVHGELGGLLERSDELGAIRAGAQAVAAGEGFAVVVEGPAGIGKTALVAAALAEAREVGLRSLAACGSELERAYGFGVARQLLEPAVHAGDGAAFEGAARYAAVLLDAAARRARRGRGRTDAQRGGAPALLRPSALSDWASAKLVRAAVPGARAPLCRSCPALSGGNPFFLGELAGALREAGVNRFADVLDAAPDGVVASVRARLTRFPQPAQQLAGAAAIVGDGG
jgi:hypothetical protein